MYYQNVDAIKYENVRMQNNTIFQTDIDIRNQHNILTLGAYPYLLLSPPPLFSSKFRKV